MYEGMGGGGGCIKVWEGGGGCMKVWEGAEGV